jgi:hypothetical protein
MIFPGAQNTNNKNISGWWYTYPSEKYEFVSWAYFIPNIWKVNPNSMVPLLIIISHDIPLNTPLNDVKSHLKTLGFQSPPTRYKSYWDHDPLCLFS